MAKNRRFWLGALAGAAVASITERLLAHRSAAKRRLAAASTGASKVVRIPLRRDDGAGDPAALMPHRGPARPVFERRGGAPGGRTAAEVQEVPGRPGQPLEHSDPAQPLRSAVRPAPVPLASDAID